MKSAALISVAEYLRTAYSPDCDYVDGEVQERNVGEKDHRRTQRQLIRYFCAKSRNGRLFASRNSVYRLNFGVPYVWVINPRSRQAWIYTKAGVEEAKDGVLRTENPFLTVSLAELFA